MQANKIDQVPLKSKRQAINQCEAHRITLFLLMQLLRPASSSSQIQMEKGYLQGYLYLPAIIQMIIGKIADTNKITSK